MKAVGWIFIAAALVAVAMLWNANPDALASAGSQIRFIHLVALLAVLALIAGPARRIQVGETVRSVGLWLLIAGALAAIYVNLDEIKAQLSPGSPVSEGGTVTLRKGYDDHFYTQAAINDRPVRMMVDTGASMIALPYEVAQRIGINVEELQFTRRIQTANGLAWDAPVVLDSVRVGSITHHNVRAGVAEAGTLDTPLLGMSFLSQLSGFRFSGDTLTLEVSRVCMRFEDNQFAPKQKSFMAGERPRSNAAKDRR